MELDAHELYREIVASHERLMWVLEFASDRKAWQGCLGAAREIDGQVRKAFEQSSRQTRRQVLWHLRQYRHATLDVSWLDERRWKTRPSAFEFALGASDRLGPDWNRSGEHPLADAATAKVAETVLRRVTRAIAELGYDAFLSRRMCWRHVGRSILAPRCIGDRSSDPGQAAFSNWPSERHSWGRTRT